MYFAVTLATKEDWQLVDPEKEVRPFDQKESLSRGDTTARIDFPIAIFLSIGFAA